jgi:alkyldihydroxyacetonephosphate synthase
MIRVSDEDESEAMLALKKESANGKSNWVKKLEKAYLKFMGINIESLSFVMIGLEGEVEENQFLRHKINTILSQNQYLNLGRKPGQSWLKDRFYAPYLRDELMDKEIFVETLETATTWANLDNLYQSVRNAILNVCQQDQLPGVIYTHLSHLYPEGASLYFSIMAPIRKDDPLGQWVDIKTAANQAIIEAKGVISHHHGIGLDHKNHLYAKDSEEFHLLKNIKKTFDPKGIMNPEKLLP